MLWIYGYFVIAQYDKEFIILSVEKKTYQKFAKIAEF